MTLKVECDCGAVKGTVDPNKLKGFRAVCLCDDCQAYAHYLHRPDILDVNGGTDIIPMMPSHYAFTTGADKIKNLRLSEQGMYRWYASCCKSPLGNTMNSAKMPYIGLPARAFLKNHSAEEVEKYFGPVRERMQAQFAIGALPEKAQKTVSIPFMLRVLKFMAVAKLTGAGSPSPFFKEGESLSQPYVLTKAEREALRPLCGVKRAL